MPGLTVQPLSPHLVSLVVNNCDQKVELNDLLAENDNDDDDGEDNISVLLIMMMMN